MKKIEKLPKIRNKNLCKKYYKIMKNDKKFFGAPKMCSNYTSKFQNPGTTKNRLRKEIISGFLPKMTNEFHLKFHDTQSEFSQWTSPKICKENITFGQNV